MFNPVKCLAHDVNNKLTVLYSRLSKTEELVCRRVSSEECLYQLTKMRQTLESISFLCQDVLRDDESCIVDIEKEFNRLIEGYESESICIQLQCHSRALIKSRPGLLQRIVDNIIHNSIDQKASHIDIAIHSHCVTITDNGGGMPTEMIHFILEGERASSKGEQRGLGLSSLVNYCQQNQWQVAIQNQLHDKGHGLMIEIRFK